jgi:SH3 domain-containing YSC84-like protein 1
MTDVTRGSLPGSQPRQTNPRLLPCVLLACIAAFTATGTTAQAPTAEEVRLVAAAAVLNDFMSNADEAIPSELLQRAQGIAVMTNVIRGGFILGGRRGRGVLVVRGEDGRFSNPAFVTLTSGSIGWQLGAQSSDLILVFANERSVQNIASGRFTLGGDASVVAGPVGRNATVAATFGSEVYAYMRSRGLFAGASFEGARLEIDAASGVRYYGAGRQVRALGPHTPATPDSASRFLAALESAATPVAPRRQPTSESEEAVTFPLGGFD